MTTNLLIALIICFSIGFLMVWLKEKMWCKLGVHDFEERVPKQATFDGEVTFYNQGSVYSPISFKQVVELGQHDETYLHLDTQLNPRIIVEKKSKCRRCGAVR